MKILVLNQNPYEFFPYKEWLKEMESDVIFLTSKKVGEQFSSNNFLYFEVFNEYETALVDVRIMQLYEKYRFELIIVLHEFDLLRVAKLREKLGIKGQSFEHALQYRDKIKMKSLLKEKSKVKIPDFTGVSYPTDIVEFIKQYSYPILIKPADSGGSMGTIVIKDEDDLQHFLRKMSMFQLASVQPIHHLIAEKFIVGEMYHVDGFIQNNELKLICPSKYLEKSLINLDQNDISGSFMLSPDNPLHERLVEETKKVLDAMPPTSNMVFHAEFFHTPENEIVFCEIASRPGGARIIEMIEVAYQYNITEAYVRAECGLDYHNPTYPLGKVVGHAVPAPKNGTLVDAPTETPFSWVKRYHLNTQLGASFHGVENSSQHIAYMIVEASDEEQLQERLNGVNNWFEEACVWESQ